MATAPKPKQEEKTVVEEQKEVLDSITPNIEHKQWTIGPSGFEKTYVQKPLGYFAKVEFYALLADALDRAMESDSGMNISSVIEGIGGGDAPFADADSLLRPMLKLVRFVPDLLEEAYCIFLNVPRGDRYMVKEWMRAPDDEGGFGDDDGLMIIQTFVDQNISSIEDFFTGRLPKLAQRVKGMSKLMSRGTK